MPLVRDLTARLRADGAKLPGDLKRAERSFKSSGKRASKGFWGPLEGRSKRFVSVAKGAFNKLRSVGRFALASIGAGAGFGLASMAGEAIKFEETLTRLQIQSGKSSEAMADFRQRVKDVSDATTLSRTSVLAAANQYVTLTGDMDVATASMETLARVAVASGGDITEIATAAASLQQQLNIDPGDLEQAFSIIVAGGKEGAVELKDLASLLPSVAAGFRRFGKTGKDGLAELGAMMQLTKQGFGSAGEAITGLEAMMTSLQKNADRFESKQIKIFQRDARGRKTSQLRSLGEIVKDISASKLAKNPTLLAKAFGRVEGLKAFQELVKVPGALEALIAKTREAKDISQDFSTFQESEAGKLKKSYNDLKNAALEAFKPEHIRAFAKALGAVAKTLATVISGVERASEFIAKPFAHKAGEERTKDLKDKASKGGFFDTALRIGGLGGFVDSRSKIAQDELDRKEKFEAERQRLIRERHAREFAEGLGRNDEQVSVPTASGFDFAGDQNRIGPKDVERAIVKGMETALRRFPLKVEVNSNADVTARTQPQ